MPPKINKIVTREEHEVRTLSAVIAIILVCGSFLLTTTQFFKNLPYGVQEKIRFIIWLPVSLLFKLFKITGIGDFAFYYFGIGTGIILLLFQALYWFLLVFIITRLLTMAIRILKAR